MNHAIDLGLKRTRIVFLSTFLAGLLVLICFQVFFKWHPMFLVLLTIGPMQLAFFVNARSSYDWQIWALERVRNVHELRRRAIKRGLIWEWESIFYKPSSRQKARLQMLRQRFNEPDHAIELSVDTPHTVDIYYSKIYNKFQFVGWTIGFISVAYVSLELYARNMLELKTSWGLGGLGALTLVMAFGEIRQLLCTAPVLTFCPDGLRIKKVLLPKYEIEDIVFSHGPKWNQLNVKLRTISFGYPLDIHDVDMDSETMEEVAKVFLSRWESSHGPVIGPNQKRSLLQSIGDSLKSNPRKLFSSPQQTITNWAGNLTYATSNIQEPISRKALIDIITKRGRLKALGSRHCFNDIADSKDHLVAMKGLNKIISVDEDKRIVTVEGGINYGQLCPHLDGLGFALHNLASLPHISVAGACITSTHGSGVGNGSLSTAVTSMQIVKANGECVELSLLQNGDLFNGVVVSLGALGVITQLTLAIEDRYDMRQYVFESMPLPSLKENFGEIMGAGYSVSLFTDWASENINEVWIKLRADDTRNIRMSGEFLGAKAATKNIHPIIEISAENCTEQLGIAGPWYERLPHFRMGFTPSSGEELQSEYFVPAKHAVEAISAIHRIGKEISPYLFISEIRAIAADNLWMSPFYQQDCIAIHFTWKQDWKNVSRLLPRIEEELKTFEVRPHWGKLFTTSRIALESLYPRFDDFRKLAMEFDPKGKFKNDFLARNLFGS